MGKKGNKRKTRWRVLPIAGDDGDCVYSTNEDDGEADHVSAHVSGHVSASPSADGGSGGGPSGGHGSYARAAQPGRGKPAAKSRPSGYQPSYYRAHRPLADRQPLVTAEKKTFNEEEYTKITTPRQDVLFKKGYLGRKRAAGAGAGASASSPSAAHVSAVTGVALTAVNVTNGAEAAVVHNGGDCELQAAEPAEMMAPVDEQPQYIYSNGYVDHGVIYMNGSYEWGYDPYGNVAVVVGPAPAYAGAGGAPPVLAAVPCQPLPLQPLEWFNPAYSVQYVAPLAAPLCPRDRRQRSSADSQNCSPQSSESTEPPGSPQDGDMDGEEGVEGVEGAEGAAALANGVDEYSMYPQPVPTQAGPQPPAQPPAQPPPYMYPGAYMFGPPFYSVNGITVQGAPQLHQSVDNSGSKRRKKKRRRRRRRGGVDDGSEESSSDEKDLEEPVSFTSQESSQEVESDSKNSEGSANCPAIVGCPQLPDRTPEAPSVSLFPCLSPSPSQPTVTENKTASSNSLLSDKTHEIIQSARSEDNSNRKGKLLNNNSVPEISNENHSEEPTAVKSESIAPDFNDLKVNNGTLNVFHDIDCNTNTLNSPTVNRNTSETVKSSQTDNNRLINDNSSLLNSKQQEERDVTECYNGKIISNHSTNGKEYSKCRRGTKSHKQKNQQTVFNGFTEGHINDQLPKGFNNVVKMDGNEVLKEDPSNPPRNVGDKRKETQIKAENIAPTVEALDETVLKTNTLEKYSTKQFSDEMPKKPSRAHQHNHKKQQQQQQQQETQSVGKDKRIQKVPQIPGAVSDSQQMTASEEPPKPLYPSPEKTTERELTALIMHQTENEQPIVSCEGCGLRAQEEKLQVNSCGAEVIPKTSSVDESILLAKEKIDEDYLYQKTPKDESSIETLSEQISDSPPVPPPRRKKWQPNRRLSAERPPTPGRELEAPKLKEVLTDDSSSSSSSHESEESVIDLLSSTPSPNNKLPDRRQTSSEDEEGVIFEGQILSKTIPADQDENISSQSTEILCQEPTCEVDSDYEENMKTASEECPNVQDTKTFTCISVEPQFVSTGDQLQHRHADVQRVSLPDFCENEHAEEGRLVSEVGQETVAKTYADGMINKVLDEGLSAASEVITKTQHQQSLSITEAVTQWLHTQDTEEVLPVPHVLEPECVEVEESEEELNMTGPKNVHRNPLLALSYEHENIYGDASTRVAFKKKNILDNENDNNIMVEHNKTIILNPENLPYCGQIYKSVDSARSCVEASVVDHCCIENVKMLDHKNGNLGGARICLETSKCILVPESDCFEQSFINKSMEYDADWECDPIILKPSAQTAALFARDDHESCLSLESPDDKCSYMCDPTRSVAKYYSLGALPEKDTNRQQMSDNYLEADDSEDEIDALVHFKRELDGHSQNGKLSESTDYKSVSSKTDEVIPDSNTYDDLYDDHFTSDSGIYSEESGNEDCRRNSSKPISLTPTILQRKSAILVSHMNGEGPFPCGGICCILQ